MTQQPMIWLQETGGTGLGSTDDRDDHEKYGKLVMIKKTSS